MTRNPMKDQVAIVGIGCTGYSRSAEGRSPASLALEAATTAIRDAGLAAADIDGIVAPGEPGAPTAHQIAFALGIDGVTHYTRPQSVMGFGLIDAANAVFSGSCDTVLLSYPVYRLPWNSRSAANDPFRARFGGGMVRVPETVTAAVGYTAWASRYIHEYGATREHFGRVAINARSNALANPLAAMRVPLTMEDYLQARMIREPLCMLDMDLPSSGAATTTDGSARRRGTPGPGAGPSTTCAPMHLCRAPGTPTPSSSPPRRGPRTSPTRPC